jgi:TonB family protein
MALLRSGLVFLALSALPAISQEPANPTPAATAPGDPANAVTAQDKPMHIGGKVQKPVVIHIAEPQFSEEARQSRYSGDVVVYLWVEKDGTPSHVRVVRKTGMGLDEKAIEAVSQYRFKPATLNGQAVVVDLYVDVSFRILQQ